MDILEWISIRDKKTDKRKLLRLCINISLVVLPCLMLLLSGIMYAAKSRDIYFWDSATYWDLSRSVAGGALKGHFWQSIMTSIAESDYNYIAALPSAAWMLIFGTSRLSYVTGLLVMYILPSVLLSYRLALKLSKAPVASYLAAVFMIPVGIYIAAIGFADVGGLLMGLACYNLYYTSGEKSGSVLRYIGIGALLSLMMLFRRYFAFFAVSFFTAMIIDCIAFKRKWYGLITAAVTTGFIMLVLFMPFVTGILLKDYGTLYAGYKFSIATDIKFITRYFGWVLLLLLFAVSLVSIVKRRDFRSVFPLLQIFVCFAMFVSTQTHGQQHLLLYIPALTVLTILLINYISKQWMLVFLALTAVVIAVSPHIDREQPHSISEIKTVSAIPTFSMKPTVRDNISSVIAVKRKLDNIIPEGSSCSVLASSFELNDSILRNAEPSVGVKQKRDGGYIVSLPEVDSRDKGRLDEIYNAEYILAAFPSQTHLAPGSQTIVDEAVTSFSNNTDIAGVFEPVEGFDEYIGDIEVKLYHRVAEIDLIRRAAYEARLFYTVE